MPPDLKHSPAIQPTLTQLRRLFDLNNGQPPAPISHPESLVFRNRFQHNHARAAVLIPIVSSGSHLQVILTRRAAHLRNHPGQISFPGGSRETHDRSPADTALRETHEEIGIPRSRIQILGELGDYYTVSGYRVTPVVSLIEQRPRLILDRQEVAEALTVPLDFLMDPGNFTLCEVEQGNEKRQYYSARYQGIKIWGVTAGIIMALYEQLLKSIAGQV